MPFDNQESHVMRMLRRGRQRLEDGTRWVKHKLAVRQPSGLVQYCMLGSVVCDDQGNDVVLGGERRLVSDIMQRGFHDYMNHRRVPFNVRSTFTGFNDAAGTSHKDMLEVFDHIIAYQEQRDRAVAQKTIV